MGNQHYAGEEEFEQYCEIAGLDQEVPCLPETAVLTNLSASSEIKATLVNTLNQLADAGYYVDLQSNTPNICSIETNECRPIESPGDWIPRDVEQSLNGLLANEEVQELMEQTKQVIEGLISGEAFDAERVSAVTKRDHAITAERTVDTGVPLGNYGEWNARPGALDLNLVDTGEETVPVQMPPSAIRGLPAIPANTQLEKLYLTERSGRETLIAVFRDGEGNRIERTRRLREDPLPDPREQVWFTQPATGGDPFFENVPAGDLLQQLANDSNVTRPKSYVVDGETYPLREQLKEKWNGKWDPATKTWIIQNVDPEDATKLRTQFDLDLRPIDLLPRSFDQVLWDPEDLVKTYALLEKIDVESPYDEITSNTGNLISTEQFITAIAYQKLNEIGIENPTSRQLATAVSDIAARAESTVPISPTEIETQRDEYWTWGERSGGEWIDIRTRLRILKKIAGEDELNPEHYMEETDPDDWAGYELWIPETSPDTIYVKTKSDWAQAVMEDMEDIFEEEDAEANVWELSVWDLEDAQDYLKKLSVTHRIAPGKGLGGPWDIFDDPHPYFTNELTDGGSLAETDTLKHIRINAARLLQDLQTLAKTQD